jgi:lipopolysaccharide transport system ATP-binding protein
MERFNTMSDVVIRVEKLSKEYRLGVISHGTLYQDLQSGWAKLRGKEDPNARIGSVNREQWNKTHDRFCALKDISFDVRQAEVVGIIGRNGAGKSTLLKIISQVTAPTSGSIKIKGRVASLLEVGTGFHPELTGRENIFLNGAILGMHKGEIEQKFDEIVKFSEVDKFIDTPVKRYSSGMYVRLAFAVAAHLEPEILVVDEVLAVGDLQFQKKCLGKMEEVSKEGRTILFVSHNMAAVQQLCNRGIVLNQGKIDFIGDIHGAIHHYIQSIDLAKKSNLIDRKDRKGSQWLKFYKVRLFDKSGKEIKQILSGQDIIVRLYYTSNKVLNNANVFVSFNVRNSMGYLLTNFSSVDCGTSLLSVYSDGFFACKWPHFNLRSGTYDCNLFCSINGEIVDWMQSAFDINVEDGDFYGSGKISDRSQGDVLISHEWFSDKTV